MLGGQKMSEIEELKLKIEKLENDKAYLKKTLHFCMCSDVHVICHKYHLQNCHICQDEFCGDNLNPLIKELKELRALKEKGEI